MYPSFVSHLCAADWHGGAGRMFTGGIYAKIRRVAMVEGLSRREVVKRFGVHRNTVTKMLSFSAPPGYRRRAWRGSGLPERCWPTPPQTTGLASDRRTRGPVREATQSSSWGGSPRSSPSRLIAISAPVSIFTRDQTHPTSSTTC